MDRQIDIGNINIIWHQTLFYTDKNTDKLYITYGYTDRMYLLVYFIDHGNCSPSAQHYSWCSLHTGISMEYVHQYILETMRIVSLHLGTILDVHYLQVYRQNVSVGIFQRSWELFPFTLALFTMFITYGYTDKMCSSVYSKY